MRLVVDSSVLEHANRSDGAECLACLGAILENESILLTGHGEWVQKINEIPNLSEAVHIWKSGMLNRCVRCERGVKHLFDPPLDPLPKTVQQHWYLLTMAHQSDKIVLYCSVVSPDCYQLAKIDHPDFVCVDWRSVHENGNLQDWLRDCK